MSTFRQKVQATTNWARPILAEPAAAARPARRTAPSRPRRKAPPVTAHRLFPAFATLWFAALFGLGSLAISSDALGALVVMIGLPALVPAAAPPLGFTAHLLVAFALGTAGAALGLTLALRLRPQDVNAQADAVRPMYAAAPFAEPEADETYKVRARDAHPDAPPRRPLVLTEAFADPQPAAPFTQPDQPEAPLLRRKPGKAASDDSADAELPSAPWIAEYTPGGLAAVEPLDLSALDLADSAQDDALVLQADAAEEEALPLCGTAMPQAEVEQETETCAQPAVPALIAATPQLPVGLAAGMAGAQPDRLAGGWSPVAGAPLESLGLVQLIERLALAMAARTAADLTDPAPPSDPAFAPGPFSAPPVPGLIGQDGIATDGPQPVSARESILRRLEAVTVPASEPAASATPPASHPASPAEPFETDDALRAALATLQRMSARG